METRDSAPVIGEPQRPVYYPLDAGQGEMAFTRASLDTSNGYIHLTTEVAVSVIDLVDGVFNIELFRSVDHGASWSHVSRLLDGSLATGFCGADPAFSGPDLFFAGGVEYLSVVTGAPEPGSPNAYNACLTFQVADPASGTLVSSTAGIPIVLQRLRAADDRFFGPCTYAEGPRRSATSRPSSTSAHPPSSGAMRPGSPRHSRAPGLGSTPRPRVA